MNDDRWRDSYDQWKAADPRDAGRPCNRCQSDEALYDWHDHSWRCAECREGEDERPAADIEDLDERCGELT